MARRAPPSGSGAIGAMGVTYKAFDERHTWKFEYEPPGHKPIGIILKVTPQVNARGFIKLTV